ncbi:hypothetical protein [Thermogemmatispora tikiterensis]|uniref:Uncharacterized protein n=1 Tax=Thermogemmatispora tikiterensis TaxID=1825093 RepID=A0A328V8R5_9CHLR|nr:hypothetical protein [Thermogemmatispora tikiterensis]RAQ94006.1 hypothetical protein A4R35_00580 [Thermogemmatispora tikiterensis]
MSRNAPTGTATRQTFAETLISNIVTGISIGAMLALLIAILGLLGIFIYGVTYPQQEVHLKLFSLEIFDFTSQGASFLFRMHAPGALMALGLLTLLGACVFWVIRAARRFQPRSS